MVKNIAAISSADRRSRVLMCTPIVEYCPILLEEGLQFWKAIRMSSQRAEDVCVDSVDENGHPMSTPSRRVCSPEDETILRRCGANFMKFLRSINTKKERVCDWRITEEAF